MTEWQTRWDYLNTDAASGGASAPAFQSIDFAHHKQVTSQQQFAAKTTHLFEWHKKKPLFM